MRKSLDLKYASACEESGIKKRKWYELDAAEKAMHNEYNEQRHPPRSPSKPSGIGLDISPENMDISGRRTPECCRN